MIKIPGRIPIYISPVFWLLILFLGWINTETVLGTAIWGVIIFVSVLIHEYGHALTALAFGQNSYIELMGLGGVTHRKGNRLSLWKEFFVILNGPLAGLLLFFGSSVVLGYYTDKPMTSMKYFWTVMVYANLFWTILNLLPIYPLDGGKIFSIILEALFGLRGMQIALFLSGIFAVLMGMVFFYLQSYLAGAIFLMFAFEGYRAWKSSLLVSKEDQDQELQALFLTAREDLNQHRDEEARAKLEIIQKIARKGVMATQATELLAGLYSKQGKLQQAYDTLASKSKNLSGEALRLYQQLAYKLGIWQSAAEIGLRAYQMTPIYDVALLNAFSYSQLGKAQPAIGWLKRALSDGLPNLKAILSKAEFDKIRQSPLFQDFVLKH